MLRFLAARAIASVEQVNGERYRRTLRAGAHAGWIEVGFDGRSSLEIALAPSLRSSRDAVRELVCHALDTDADPQRIEACLGALARTRPGLRVAGAFDGFEIAVRAVLGQQVTVKAGITLARRFAQRFGEPIVTPFAELDRLFPLPVHLLDVTVDEIASLGITGARSATILALARAVHDGTIALHPGADREQTVRALRSIRGIGEWTADYIAMRALDDGDIFLHGDLGVQDALGYRDATRAREAAEAWRPYRSYAVIALWSARASST